MVTPLDSATGFLQQFDFIFPMILVFAVVYGLLSWSKLLGENKGIHAAIALVLSFMVLFSKTAVQIINYMSPWFILVFLLILFMLMAFKFLGASDKDIASALTTDKTIIYWIIIISVIIFLAALGKVFFAQGGSPIPIGGMATPPTSGASPGENAFWSTIFHPKVLGAILILLVGSFATMMLATEAKK